MSAPIRYGMLRRSRRVGDAIANIDLSIDLRLFLLATWRANANGHAVFEPGEIVNRLSKVNQKTGELTTYTPDYLRRVVKRLDGLLAPVSRLPDIGRACLVLPMQVWEYGGTHRAAVCPVHKNKMLWHDHGWFDPDDLGTGSDARSAIEHWGSLRAPSGEVA